MFQTYEEKQKSSKIDESGPYTFVWIFKKTIRLFFFKKTIVFTWLRKAKRKKRKRKGKGDVEQKPCQIKKKS